MNQKSILISIKPKYTEMILNGEKTIEVRRSFSKKNKGCEILIYATRPVMAIVGTAKIRHIDMMPPEWIWDNFKSSLGLSEKDLYSYLKGREKAFAIDLSDVMRLEKQINIHDLRKAIGFIPPQSYNFASHQLMALLNK
jgi:predicted transcriptional regulator